MNIAVLLSAGKGLRLGADLPKQYIPVAGHRIITYTLRGLLENRLVDGVWIVAEEAWRDEILHDVSGLVEDSFSSKICGFSKGGANRQLSIYNALCDIGDRGVCLPSANGTRRLTTASGEAVKSVQDTVKQVALTDEDVILVQDAVRPLTSQEQLTTCLTRIEGYDGALPVLPMKDTIYTSRDGKEISGLLDRSTLYAGQAPEAYRFGKYKKACEGLLPDKILMINGACEPAVMAGMDIAMFPGDEMNFKITTPADLARFEEMVEP